jgi:hypothetical protein
MDLASFVEDIGQMVMNGEFLIIKELAEIYSEKKKN